LCVEAADKRDSHRIHLQRVAKLDEKIARLMLERNVMAKIHAVAKHRPIAGEMQDQNQRASIERSLTVSLQRTVVEMCVEAINHIFHGHNPAGIGAPIVSSPTHTSFPSFPDAAASPTPLLAVPRLHAS
jgi:hypothetical protein